MATLFAVFIAGAVFMFFYGRKVLQKHIQSTYAVRDPEGVELLTTVSIGGIDQWIHARGRNGKNPILLFVHGGPGWPNIGWHDAIQRPWENYFTVVQWDQRQSGKSYQSMSKIGHTLSRQQYLQDAEDMVQHLQERFGTRKIFLMGTSYGTNIGMHLAKKHPDWFYAYIGIGQVVTKLESVRVEYELLLNYTRENGLTEFNAELKALDDYPDPANPAQSFYDNALRLQDIGSRIGKAYPDSMSALFSMAAINKLISPLYTLKDNFNRKYGGGPDAKHPFAEEFIHYDLPKELGYKFELPIFFFTGAHDYHIPYHLTDEWFKKIEAPYKEQVWFQDSAHVPFQTEPAAFVMALVNKVLPMAKEQQP
jgi:pimeloyl-ACP methyl ester carboxylesterase